jgi:RNA polymerase sigma-70 factor (ECF subfamily)
MNRRPDDLRETLHPKLREACLKEARRYLPSETDAQDVVQEALLRAWRHRGGCRNPADPLQWLLTITRREALRRVGKPRSAPLDDAAEPADTAAGEEIARARLRIDVARALARLPVLDRRIVVLRYQLDLSHADLAKLFGVAEVTVRVRLHRAQRQLRLLMTT